MKKILINGNFLCRNLTGIERFAFETLKRMDNLISKDYDINILVPVNAKIIPEYKNIKIIKSQKPLASFPKWDLLDFKKECKKIKATGLSFSNTAPLGKNTGYAFIHDIYAADCPKDFTTFKDKLVKIYSCFHYKNIARHAEKLFTVSQFSKDRIIKKYKTNENKIAVIPNGWEHFNEVKEDDSILQKFNLKSKDFYFTLGSLSKRKNLKWIADYAQHHDDETFAISGKAISGLVPDELKSLQNLSNVILLGYVTDEEVKSLMKNCKAFVFPSYYEGFGIPPLEALSVGAKIIVSKDASLPEIYKDCAYFIDTKKTGASLKDILKSECSSPDSTLEKYTYLNAAKELLKNLS